MILEGFKGAGKSHLLFLLFFFLTYNENYRVFYLNEVEILTSLECKNYLL